MTTLSTVTAAEIAADFTADDGDSRFSLAAGRGFPGVITKVVTAAEIAADFTADDGDSRFSLAAGRGFPGVITKVEMTDTGIDDDVIWITWEDGNGEHQSRYLPGEAVQVIVGYVG